MTTLDDLRYLWDGSEPGWVLVDVSDEELGWFERYCMYNCLTKDGLIIENDSVSAQAIAMMRAAEVPVIRPADK